MLGSFGFFASRGMTTVPDLSGLSKTAAEAAITAAGLTVGTGTSSGSSISSQDNIVSAQSVASGQVVDYDTQIDFSYYLYVAPSPGGGGTPVTCIVVDVDTLPPVWDENVCNDGQRPGSQETVTTYSNCTSTSTFETVYQNCGTSPACTGSQTETFTTCGTCSGGIRTCNYYREVSYTNCDSVVTSYDYTESCVSPTPPPPPPPPPPPAPVFVPGTYIPTTPSVNWPPGTPANQCVDADTEIIVVASNGQRSYVKARDVEVGDYVLAMTWDELVDQDVQNFMFATSSNLTNIDTLPTMVVAKYEYEKPTTMYINNDITTRMSLEQPMLINRDGIWQWRHTGDIYIGDKFIQYVSEDQVIEVEVTAVDYISEMRDVYSFNCEDTDTFFAGNILVHNK